MTATRRGANRTASRAASSTAGSTASRTADVAPSRGRGSRTVDAVAAPTRLGAAQPGDRRAPERRSPDRRTAGGAHDLDPRLQARRHQVARQEGRRRLRLVAAATLAATLAIMAIAAVNSSLLDIERVTVSGASRTDPRQVVVATGLEAGQPLIGVQPAEVVAAVQRVPWVDTARVQRSWRGDVTVAVTERRAVLAMPAGSRFALVDPTGRQLEIVDGPPEGMLVLSGLDASGVPGQAVPAAAVTAVAALEGLSPEIAARTTGLSVDDGQVFVDLGSVGRAEIGDGRDLGAKMVALETVLARVDLSCVDVIDVRVPSAPTVRRADPGGGRMAAPGADSEEPLASAGGC